MICTKCKTENSDNAKFCKKCGNNLIKTIDAAKIDSNNISSFLNIKIFAAGALVLLILGGIYYFSKNGIGSNNSMGSLDDLIKLDKEVSQKFGTGIFGVGLSKDKASEIYDDVVRINKMFSREVDDFLSTAKKIDVNNQDKMKDFLVREAKLRELAESENSCISGEQSLGSYLSKSDIGNFKDKIVDEFKKSCEISRLLDACQIKREIEVIEGSFEEEDNAILPAGYSITTIQPVNGQKTKVAILIDGKERRVGEVVTQEPVIGKKIKGTGNSEDIAKIGGDLLNKIRLLWNEQKLIASEVLPYLSEEMKSKAQDIESNYKKVAYNYKRFNKIEPMFGQASFKEKFGNKQYPFELYLPVVVGGVEAVSPYSVKFFYSAENNNWVADYETFDNLFNIVKYQNLIFKANPGVFRYSQNDKCKNGWFTELIKDIKIENFTISGFSGINLKTDGSMNSWTIGIGDHKNTIETRNYRNGLPLETLEYINNNKTDSVTASEFKYISGSSTSCISDAMVTLSLIE